MLTVPIFAVTILLILWSTSDKSGFDVVWRYFAWFNQTLSVFTLWAVTVYLVRERKLFVVSLIPALFMTAVTSTYLLIAPECFHLSPSIAYPAGIACTAVSLVWFALWMRRERRRG